MEAAKLYELGLIIVVSRRMHSQNPPFDGNRPGTLNSKPHTLNPKPLKSHLSQERLEIRASLKAPLKSPGQLLKEQNISSP